MYEKIEKVINNWDPLELFPFAPKDEYENEINKILGVLKKDPTNVDLGKAIEKIFLDSFGKGIINENEEKYLLVSNEILKEVNKA
ncbi:DUF1871 family protein [Carnobacterium gallinarum]|uniref:DUF1871 family protein n=1 Tax=Carnobacterium gallinarum TaxID=2749 RepID=UPI00054E548B|nr:DUF1871 family protein [Carnobacterium gallinarum]